MKKLLLIIACIFITTIVFSATDYLIKAPSGNLIIDAATGSVVKINKTLQVDAITNYAGISSPPGMVPIGGMIAVMPTTHANAWQPPSTGVIKDGFMRADGNTVPTCSDCIIPAGTTLPSMITKYPRGNTTSGTTGGSNTYTPVGTNVASNVPASGLTFSGTPASYSVTVPGHKHNTFALAATLGSTIITSTIARSTVILDYCSTGPGGSITHGVCPTTSSTQPYVASIDIGHSHTITGTVGYQSGSNGDAVGGFAASGSNTPAGTLAGTATAAAQIFTGTSGNNEPAYVEVVWVIRIK